MSGHRLAGDGRSAYIPSTTLTTSTTTTCVARTVMEYREIQPDPRLRAFVTCYWILRGENSGSDTERILPDGCCELVFHCGDHFDQILDGKQVRQPRQLLIGPT